MHLAPPPIRVSIVDFLNAAPLAYGIEKGFFPGRFAITRDVPSACAEKLARGGVDVGLVPSIAYQTIPGLSVLPHLCIAADGDVRSVLLLTRRGRPLDAVRTVAADPASRTSAALVRILLGEMGVRPGLEEASGEPRSLLRRFDAVLAIGDRALRARASGLVVHDLAGIWRDLTGLPFVFALWAVAPGVHLGDAAPLFDWSRALGEGNLDAIVAGSRRRVGLTAAELRRYFTRNLRYRMGPRELEGLERFYELAARHGIIGPPRPLRLYGQASAPFPAEPGTAAS